MRSVMILVTGLPGSGKSVFSDVARSLCIPVVTLGDVVREEVSRRGLEPTLENIMSIAQELRNSHGLAAIAMMALGRIRESLRYSCVVVVDGVRSLEEVNYLKSEVEATTILVAIHASPLTRFRRLISRGRSGDPKNWDEFVERDLRELSWGLGNVIALADVVFVNEGSVDEFKKCVNEFLTEVKRKWCT